MVTSEDVLMFVSFILNEFVFLLHNLFINPFMDIVVKWPDILQKSCVVNTARFLKYVWPFYNIMHEKVNDFGFSGSFIL